MPKGKKKFIDKKSAVTFHLVHRSQQDPLIADETAPQHVLLPTTCLKKGKLDDRKRKEEQKKYGIFFDDDYNYLQHLRNVNQIAVDWEPVPNYARHKEEFPSLSDSEPQESKSSAKLQLPSSVFASSIEEDVGLLNKAAPRSGLRLELDPDVVAAMDEDFDFDNPDNVLQDNFIELVFADGEADIDNELSDVGSYNSSSNDYVLNVNCEENEEIKDSEFTFAEEETKSCFTHYSMSSSVIRRNEHLSLLDSRFEQFFVGYDDNEIGALDCEEIEGNFDPASAIILQNAKDFECHQTTQRHETDNSLSTAENMYNDSENSYMVFEVPNKSGELWDCESILSTYSNIYNHPKLINEPMSPGRIRVNGRTGIPLDVLGSSGGSKLTAYTLVKLDLSYTAGRRKDRAKSILSTLSELSIRPKEEKPGEKKQRKKAVREYRKERRMERKANSFAFKEEKKRQEKVLLNNNTNQQGLKIV